MRYKDVRIASPNSDYDADLIKLLTPEERTSALLYAASLKVAAGAANTDEELRPEYREQLDQVLGSIKKRG